MKEIKCPKCGTMFQIDEKDYDSIVKQLQIINKGRIIDERNI